MRSQQRASRHRRLPHSRGPDAGCKCRHDQAAHGVCLCTLAKLFEVDPCTPMHRTLHLCLPPIIGLCPGRQPMDIAGCISVALAWTRMGGGVGGAVVRCVHRRGIRICHDVTGRRGASCAGRSSGPRRHGDGHLHVHLRGAQAGIRQRSRSAHAGGSPTGWSSGPALQNRLSGPVVEHLLAK